MEGRDKRATEEQQDVTRSRKREKERESRESQKIEREPTGAGKTRLLVKYFITPGAINV